MMAAQFQLTARRVSLPPGIPAAGLGESPSWDDQHKALWWIDILGQTLFVAQPSAGTTCDFGRVAVLPLQGHRVGFVVHASTQEEKTDGKSSATPPYHAVWGSQSGLYYTPFGSKLPWRTVGSPRNLPQLASVANATHHRIAPFPLSTFPLQGGRIYRFNDGKVGPDGSLWAGGMMERSAQHPKRDPGCGALLQWTPQATTPFTAGVSQVTISNGMGWSPAGDVLYHVDTPTGVIRAYPYHKTAAGSPAGTPGYIKQSEGYVFWALPADRKARGATLDGLCVDDAGAVWVALAGIGEVVRLSARRGSSAAALPPAVTVTGVVTVPGVTLSTSCCFGGEDLTTLYITTARGTDAAAVAKCTQEGAGFVYAVNLKGIAKGMPPSRLRLPPSIHFSRL